MLFRLINKNRVNLKESIGEVLNLIIIYCEISLFSHIGAMGIEPKIET
jgi:hypothetical protein